LNTRSDALNNQFETRLNARSDALSTQFDTAIDRLETRLNPTLEDLRLGIDRNRTIVHQVEEHCAGVRDRLDTFDENTQDLLARTEELKLEVRAG
jgi:hypothetical protein